jgi:hypothetical protein
MLEVKIQDYVFDRLFVSSAAIVAPLIFGIDYLVPGNVVMNWTEGYFTDERDDIVHNHQLVCEEEIVSGVTKNLSYLTQNNVKTESTNFNSQFKLLPRIFRLYLRKHFSREHVTVLLYYRLCMSTDFLLVTNNSWILQWKSKDHIFILTSLWIMVWGKKFIQMVSIYSNVYLRYNQSWMWSAQMTVLLNKHCCKTEIGIGIEMIVNWDMNSLCLCHSNLTNVYYNNAEECICILECASKRLFKIFCFWLPFTNYRSFFSCFDSLQLNLRQDFSTNWLLYSCLYPGFPYDFLSGQVYI